jgi:hypothetical protein
MSLMKTFECFKKLLKEVTSAPPPPPPAPPYQDSTLLREKSISHNLNCGSYSCRFLIFRRTVRCDKEHDVLWSRADWTSSRDSELNPRNSNPQTIS